MGTSHGSLPVALGDWAMLLRDRSNGKGTDDFKQLWNRAEHSRDSHRIDWVSIHNNTTQEKRLASKRGLKFRRETTSCSMSAVRKGEESG
jgi:hypothetical protein